MARRASSGLNPGVILGAVVVVGLLGLGAKMMLKDKPAGFTDAQPLDVQQLLENGNSLRDNVYAIEGEIERKIGYSKRGQLVSVRVKTSGEDHFIPVEIPKTFNNLNIETHQKYAFRVKFREGGIPVATGINKL